MGYQLPDDVDAVSGLRWYLVAVPDDDAYGIAALGAYTELADVWKWGKEGITADSYTARQQWLSAIDETLEALEMGFPTTLLNYIDEVETLLEAIRDAQQIAQPCCDSTLYNPAPAAIDETTDSVPQVIQDNYTTGDDWGEVWESYMCPLLREAWTRIDDHVLEPWEYYINLGGGGVAVLTTLYVAWAGIGAAVVVAGFTIADVLALFAAVKGYIGEAVMGDYSDWDTHADDFICAVRDADGPEAKQVAAEDFIDSLSYSAPVKLLARFAFHSGFWRQVYTGIGADGNEIIVSGDGCPTCALDYDFEHAAYFETNYDGFTKDAAVSRVSDCSNMTVALSSGAIEITGANAAIEAGFSYTPGGSFYVVEVVTDVCTTGTLRVTTNGGVTHDITSAPIVDTWEPSQASPATNMRFQAITGGGRISSVVTKWRYEPPA